MRGQDGLRSWSPPPIGSQACRSGALRHTLARRPGHPTRSAASSQAKAWLVSAGALCRCVLQSANWAACLLPAAPCPAAPRVSSQAAACQTQANWKCSVCAGAAVLRPMPGQRGGDCGAAAWRAAAAWHPVSPRRSADWCCPWLVPRTLLGASQCAVLACRSALCTRCHVQARSGIPGEAGLCLHPTQLPVCSEALPSSLLRGCCGSRVLTWCASTPAAVAKCLGGRSGARWGLARTVCRRCLAASARSMSKTALLPSTPPLRKVVRCLEATGSAVAGLG